MKEVLIYTDKELNNYALFEMILNNIFIDFNLNTNNTELVLVNCMDFGKKYGNSKGIKFRTMNMVEIENLKTPIVVVISNNLSNPVMLTAKKAKWNVSHYSHKIL